ncbi:MAG: class I SAM-dependent methyltransferase [Euzebya sp.]
MIWPLPATPRWVLDEVSTAGWENLDADHVSNYDDKEDSGAAAEIELLAEFGLNELSVVVDLGTGTGQFAVAVAPRCARVVAVDISPVMLAHLQGKVAASGYSNIEVVRAGFLTYHHNGTPADIVYSRWALHHIPDFWKSLALQRMRASMRPGAVLRLSDVVYSFQPADAEDRIEAWCATLPVAAGPGEWIRRDIEDHVRDEHSTYTWLLEPMIQRCGFRIERQEYSDDGFFADYMLRAV